MPLVEVIIIYLSAGAPFGVLVLFSQKTSPAPIAAFYALLATLTWPILGSYRLYKGLTLKRGRQFRFDSDVEPLQILERLSQEVPTGTAELFEIAGHSNPWVATNCYARARKKVIASHIDRMSLTPEKNAGYLPNTTIDAAVSPRIAVTVRP